MTARAALCGGLAALFAAAVALASTTPRAADGHDFEVIAAQVVMPSVEAYFERESYRPGARARLVVQSRSGSVTLQIFRIGDVPLSARGRFVLQGAPITEPRDVRLPRRTTFRVDVPIGDWRSGVYYAELRDRRGLVGYAPFVMVPERLGETRVAVVMPTNTWFAYNRRDRQTWYENRRVRTVDMRRPFLDRGVPPNFRRYDYPFLRWLEINRHETDFLSQLELESGTTGAALAAAYDLIVFPGHHEYVTTREYDVIERYRDLGGNLMFLSANNFYWHTVKDGRHMRRTRHYHDLGRPEAALIGVQYIANDRGQHRGPFVIRRSDAGAWIFAGTDLRPGDTFGSFGFEPDSFGIEIDHTNRFSPAGTDVVAEIPNLFRVGRTAQLTYYETEAGAKVFAAGAFTLAGAALTPPVPTILDNVWHRLVAP